MGVQNEDDLLDGRTTCSDGKRVALGTCITSSGVDYAYIMEAFRPLWAFVQLWVNLVVLRPTTQAIVAMTFAQNAVKPFYLDCAVPENAVRLLEAVCLCKYCRWCL